MCQDAARTVAVGDGRPTEAFNVRQWAQALAVAAIWGSSFMWIAIGLDSLTPATVAFGRVALATGALWVLPAARSAVERSAWPVIIVVAVAGNAGPALLFAIAQQYVDSSVAGMMNASTPVATVAVGITMTRQSPGRWQVVGVAVGCIGVVLMGTPSLAGASAGSIGVVLIAVAVVGYGLSNNVIAVPQRRYGSAPIVARALLVSSLLLAPLGVHGLADSTLTVDALIAVLILAVVGTAVARVLNASLIGSAGAARASIVTYLAPVVAIVLGATVRDERIEAIEFVGIAITLAGSYATTRHMSSSSKRSPATREGGRPLRRSH